MHLYFYTREGCHLCDRLESLIAPHLKAPAQPGGAELIERNIEENDAWYEKYWDRIPVVELDGAVVLEGKPEAAEVATAMKRLNQSCQ
ncbi:MAG: glutaredoxin family protein [Phycisphaeraceae bacterium]